MATGTLFEALSAIPDHRTKKGRRFPLAAIVTIALAAMLAGANDLLAIARFGRRLSPKALQALGVDKKRRRAPCHATYHYIFQSIAAEELKAALGTLVATDDGLGYCFVGAFHDEQVSRVLGLPDWVRPVGIIPLGFPKERPPRLARIPLAKVVHKESW